MTNEVKQALSEIQDNRKPNESITDWVDRCNNLLTENGEKAGYVYCPECEKPMQHRFAKVRAGFVFHRCMGCFE